MRRAMLMLLTVTMVACTAGVALAGYSDPTPGWTYLDNSWYRNSTDADTGEVTHWFASNDGRNTPHDLHDLDHYRYYTWGLEWNVPMGDTITEASLTFNDIRNWDNDRDPNTHLFVQLLDEERNGGNDLLSGVREYYDGNHSIVNAFGGVGTNLDGEDLTSPNNNPFNNMPDYAHDITYDFDGDDLASLNNYASDGMFGFGFDPDCHFYNNGIILKITTGPTGGGGGEPVPEPGTIALLGIGLLGLAGVGRKKAKKNK